jgi:hypothetical protein
MFQACKVMRYYDNWPKLEVIARTPRVRPFKRSPIIVHWFVTAQEFSRSVRRDLLRPPESLVGVQRT